MENLRISTMTQVATISTSIVLETLFQGLQIGPKLAYIAHGYNTKGDLKKKKKVDVKHSKQKKSCPDGTSVTSTLCRDLHGLEATLSTKGLPNNE